MKTRQRDKAKAKGNSRLTNELLETARDLRASGLLSKAVHEKITKRHLGTRPAPNFVKLTGQEIRALRKSANLSQSVFAFYLNLTPGYVSQLERGEKEPKGPALALLNVIKRKGIEAILG